MIKILVTDGMASDGVGILKSEVGFDLNLRKETPVSELMEMVADVDCLVIRSATKVTKEVLDKAKNLKLICRAGAGVDNVDVPAATQRKVAVMNTASANSLAAAEHTIALIFAVFKNIGQAHQSMKNEKWDRATFTGSELTDKTLGVLGLGNIGRVVADRAVGLRMNVVGYDPLVTQSTQLPVELRNKIKLEASIDSVLSQADAVTLHLPLTAETKNILSKERMQKMKDGAYLINCARGGLVDESAVCDLLDSGKLKGVAFDVFSEEPVKFPNRLTAHPKAVVTPHLGASTVEAQLRVGLTAARQIVGFFKNGDKTGVLN
jgi:D-3-phosphoglycerate dehydrogenase / 2-oxoglutarate reductase